MMRREKKEGESFKDKAQKASAISILAGFQQAPKPGVTPLPLLFEVRGSFLVLSPPG